MSETPQGPDLLPRGPAGGRGCLYSILAALAVATVLIIVIVVVLNNEARKIAPNGNLGGPPPPAKYKVGQTGASGGLAFTLYGVKYPVTGLAPPTGDQYVEVDVEVQNLSETSQVNFSAIAGFHVLDRFNHPYDETVVPGVNPSAPDGQIAAQQALRGYVVFAVPTGSAGLKLRCQGTITSAGAVFALT